MLLDAPLMRAVPRAKIPIDLVNGRGDVDEKLFHGAGVPIVKAELLKPSSGFIVPFSIGQSLSDSHLSQHDFIP